MNRKTVDVIIPTYKPNQKFEQLIKRLKGQSYPIKHIYVINTEEKLFPKEFMSMQNVISLEHIRLEEFDHGGTRDKVARQAKSDIIVFMTQDAVPKDAHLIENLVSCFDSEEIGAAYARQLPDRGCNEIERFTRSFNYPDKSSVKSKADIKQLGIKTYFCSNVCAAYQRELYLSLGGFIKHTIFNEDMIFATKIISVGKKISYCSKANVIHSHNYGNLQQLRRNFDLGVSQKEYEEVFAGVKSEDEGIRLVLKTARHCISIKKPWLLIHLFFQSAFKYMGYKLGINYKFLPKWLIRKLTMNQAYWN